jgi:hypothetical protein
VSCRAARVRSSAWWAAAGRCGCGYACWSARQGSRPACSGCPCWPVGCLTPLLGTAQHPATAPRHCQPHPRRPAVPPPLSAQRWAATGRRRAAAGSPGARVGRRTGRRAAAGRKAGMRQRGRRLLLPHWRAALRRRCSCRRQPRALAMARPRCRCGRPLCAATWPTRHVPLPVWCSLMRASCRLPRESHASAAVRRALPVCWMMMEQCHQLPGASLGEIIL